MEVAVHDTIGDRTVFVEIGVDATLGDLLEAAAHELSSTAEAFESLCLCVASSGVVIDVYGCDRDDPVSALGLEDSAPVALRHSGAYVAAQLRHGGLALHECPAWALADRAVALAAVEAAPLDLEQLGTPPLSWHDDAAVVGAALHGDPHALSYASARLRDDEELVAAALGGFRFASERLRASEVLALQAVAFNGLALAHCSAALRATRSVVLAAVQQQGYALRFADAALLHDDGVVREALRQNGNAVQFVDPKAPLFREWVLEAVETQPTVLQHLGEEVQADREIVEAAVKVSRAVLRYASPELRADSGLKALVSQAVYRHQLPPDPPEQVRIVRRTGWMQCVLPAWLRR